MTRHQTRVRRATPADPMPGVTQDESSPSSEGRKLPPELGPGAVAVTEGRSFMYSDSAGDVPPGSIGGLVSEDTRLLSRWALLVNGARLLTLRSGLAEPYWAAFFLTNPTLPGLRANTIGVRRLRLLGDGLRERIEVQSFAHEAIEVELRLATGADFADLFEIKDRGRDRSAEVTRDHDPLGTCLRFGYRKGDFEAGTEVRAFPAAADRARSVVDRLMSDELFSGWGMRTLSTMDAGYNPIGYHTGTVWPHDNSIIIAGLTRYGYREEAKRIAVSMLDAAESFNYQPPEAISGYPRSYASFPIPYPTACSPQAWASGAPLLIGRSLLGMDAVDGALRLDPDLPELTGRVFIHNLIAFGRHWDIEAVGRTGYVRLAR
jgi:glycogen debranching enzyme